MRKRSILVALTAALAVGGFSAYAANTQHGSTVSVFARTTTLEGADRGDAVSDVARVQGALRSTTFRTGAPKSRKEEAKESAACETAENALAALRAADRSEDKAEHAAAATAAKGTDKTEDRTERAMVVADREAVEAACRPKLSAACISAIDALKALRSADRAEDAAEVRPTTAAARAADRIEDAAERQAHLTAVRNVVAACAGQR